MKARKILAVSLTAAMTLALAACGGSSSDKESSSKDSSDKVYKIGICQQLEHAALDEATKGFEEACEEKFGKDKVKFDLQNGQGEQANCATIVNNFVADNDDLILANATTALQCAAAATSTIPILGTSVTDYATALDISDWTGSTGMNISGTCDLAPIDEQEAMLKELGLSHKKHTTDDMLFTVETVSCLGACGLAPTLTVNDEVHPKMTPEKAVELLYEMRGESE